MAEKMNQKISVIVPVYKAEKFIHRCVESILSQMYDNIELILVDDGSPDKSGALCDEYALKDDRVRVIHQVNSGVAVARNAGLDKATGEYIAFVDSDDYIDFDMYYEMMKIVQKYNCDVVMCDCLKEFPEHREVFSHDIRAGYYSGEQLRDEYYQHLIMMENVEYPPTISNWTCLFKNKQCTNGGLHYLPGIRFSEDLFFGAQLMRQAESFYYMKGECYYHYCMNPQSVTHVYAPDKWEDYKRLHSGIKEFFLNDQEYNFKKQIDLCLLFFVYNAIGDIFSVMTLSKKEKKEKISEILSEKEVRTMFNSLDVIRLPISFKQKVITWCYKYRVGIRFLIKYYE